MTFETLGLKPELLSAITDLGFSAPMPVQAKTIPFIFTSNDDLVALAQTGTGKTAAFGLPILNLIEENLEEIQSLILAPTRELCIQIAQDLRRYSKNLKVRVVPVYGGESIVTQLRQLDKQPQVLVATPGRLIDLISRKKVRLSGVKFFVLDEADEMLNMGFLEEIEQIIQNLPDNRRTFLFSATMPDEVQKIAKNYMKSWQEIALAQRNSGNENVEHRYFLVQASQRYLALKRLVDVNPDIYGIIFCRTRQETKDVAEKLMQDGYNADSLHGDLSQAQRDAVMAKFRKHNIQLLVATDVAARGLDVQDLTHVINFNLPDEPEIYTHRSGRTGRAGKKGVSLSIVHLREVRRIENLEKMLKQPFVREKIPLGNEVCKKQLFHLISKMENVELSEEINPYLPEIVKKLDYLEKEDLIKRFVSIEFNRFLEYYKNAPDLNPPEKEPRSKKEKSAKKSPSKRGEIVRFKINLGSKHGFNINRLLGYINDVTCDKSIKIGDIEITARNSFFDVYADQAISVAKAFSSQKQNGVTLLAVESSKPKREKPFREKPPRENLDKPWRRGRR